MPENVEFLSTDLIKQPLHMDQSGGHFKDFFVKIWSTLGISFRWELTKPDN